MNVLQLSTWLELFFACVHGARALGPALDPAPDPSSHRKEVIRVKFSHQARLANIIRNNYRDIVRGKVINNQS